MPTQHQRSGSSASEIAAWSPIAKLFIEALLAKNAFDHKGAFARLRYECAAERGRAHGYARALLTILRVRDIHVPEEAEARIRECTDLEQLDTWVYRAATAKSLDKVFGR
ncbi:hypothetical protein [Nocardia sp. NPDC050793]|uniref:hypothetical protein n=1 Tax=Nocardia sp. NPDC050793 TaxID=3155159 RepID=UPI0033E69BD4